MAVAEKNILDRAGKYNLSELNNHKYNKIYNFVNSGPVVSWFEFANFIKQDLKEFDSNMFEEYLEVYCEKIARTRNVNIKLDIDSDKLFIPFENAPCFYCNSNNLAKLRDFEDAEIHIRNYIIYDGKFPDCDAVVI